MVSMVCTHHRNLLCRPHPFHLPSDAPHGLSFQVPTYELPESKVPVLEVPVLEVPVLEVPVLEVPGWLLPAYSAPGLMLEMPVFLVPAFWMVQVYPPPQLCRFFVQIPPKPCAGPPRK